MLAPEASLYGAILNANEYGWKPENFTRALSEATAGGLVCIGGQFQFQLPGGTCEMYWLNADSAPRASDESWRNYVERAASEVKAVFEKIVRETDFLSEADQFEFLREQKANGVNILDSLQFVAYFSQE